MLRGRLCIVGRGLSRRSHLPATRATSLFAGGMGAEKQSRSNSVCSKEDTRIGYVLAPIAILYENTNFVHYFAVQYVKIKNFLENCLFLEGKIWQGQKEGMRRRLYAA